MSDHIGRAVSPALIQPRGMVGPCGLWVGHAVHHTVTTERRARRCMLIYIFEIAQNMVIGESGATRKTTP